MRTDDFVEVFDHGEEEIVELGDCEFCRASEHEDYDNDIRTTVYKRPESAETIEANLCAYHRDSLYDAGFEVISPDE
jgi:hypothetical protein